MFDESELWTEDESYESGGESLYDFEEVGDEYEAIRPLLAEGWRNADPEQIEALLENVTASMTVEEAENFWSTISNIGRSIAPIASQVVGIAAPLVGGAIGGPVGASLGGTLGSLAGGALSSLGGRPVTPPRAAVVASPIRAALPTAGALAAGALATAAPTSATASATTAATSASSQLLSFLQNPQLLQSLLQQLLGGAGGAAVPVGTAGASAPFGAFMNALSVLAGRAAAEAESESTDSSYLFGASGELIADPHSPDERAAALLEHLRT